MKQIILFLNKKYTLFSIGKKTLNYLLNPTKNEIRNVIFGKSKVSNGKSIHAAATYLGRNAKPSYVDTSADIRKSREQEILKTYAIRNGLQINIDHSKYVPPGGVEHKIYRYDDKTIVKTNNLHYYNSWKDYFNSLLLHNYFFPDTAYDLIGFTEEYGKLFPVVKQEFIQATIATDIEDIRKFASDNGFISDEDYAYNYINRELGITLEDLHRLNVLTRENPKTKQKVLYFIDTVFHILPTLWK